MHIAQINGVKIRAVYGCLPQIKIDNRESLKALYGDTADNIIKATGIETRYIVSPGTSSLDLCVKAAEALFSDNDYDRSQIAAVICVSFTPHTWMPNNSSGAQSRLGLANNIAALDLNLACSGYPYGLFVAAGIAKSLGGDVLLLDGDVQSAYISPDDAATVPVLSDAGTATLIQLCGNDTWSFTFYADGARGDVLTIPAGGSAYPPAAEHLIYKDYEGGSRRRDFDIAMDGFAVFKFVAQDVSKMLKQYLDGQQKSAEPYAAFIPHQANMYMITQLARRVGFTAEQLWRSGDLFGNSASATIPMTIAHQAKDKLKEPLPKPYLLAGFGAGLSIGVADIMLHSDMSTGIVEYGSR